MPLVVAASRLRPARCHNHQAVLWSEHRIGLDHISLGVPGAELERLADELSAAGVQTGGIQRDVPGPALVCFRDPDNIAWECFQNE
jgi:catechol 2,3-dioxygenase-like lactoylglutathione lyase family enzyme